MTQSILKVGAKESVRTSGWKAHLAGIGTVKVAADCARSCGLKGPVIGG
jgi:hypothetical protein